MKRPQTLRLVLTLALGCALLAPAPAAASTVAAANATRVTINAAGPAAPYPATIDVSGAHGVVAGLTLTLRGFRHEFADDVDVMLAAPSGASAVVLSDAGGPATVGPIDLTLDDDAPGALPDGCCLAAGVFRPANYGNAEAFPAPAPAPGPATALGPLAGGNPNGRWALYVLDDLDLYGGEIVGGWSLTLRVEPLSASGASVTEGDAGQTDAVFVVALPEARDVPVVADYATVDGTATAASGDYVATGGRLTFAPGETTKTVTVKVSGDTADESDETFFLQVGSERAPGAIRNDDVPQLSVADGSVLEGQSGVTNLAFAISLGAPASNLVTLRFATADATAASPDDYGARSGSVTFLPGQTTRTVTVPVNGDVVDEPTETFSLTLSQVTNAAVLRGTATGTIVDDDAPETTIAPGPGPFSKPDVSITFASSDAAATFECALDDAAFAACSSPAALAGLSEGEHRFRVVARDAAGNVDPTPAEVTWIVDGTLPQAAFTAPRPGDVRVDGELLASAPAPSAAIVATGPVEMAASVFDLHLSAIRFLVDGQVVCDLPPAPGNAQGSATYRCDWTAVPGQHRLRLEAADAAGNLRAEDVDVIAVARWSL